MVGALILAFGVALVSGQIGLEVETHPLTLRGVERAIDRAFVAELAGDFKGGRQALTRLLESKPRPEEAAARARLTAWLVSMRAREEAFALSGRTARGYAQAFSTLREFGPERGQLLWQRALRDLPQVRHRTPRVRVRFERLLSVKRDEVSVWLSPRLVAAGFALAEETDRNAHYELRMNLDARQAETRMARTRVTVEGSFLLRRCDEEEQVVASYAKRRAVVRRTEEAARAFAVRRAVDDLAWAAIFRLRAASLRDAEPADGERGL